MGEKEAGLRGYLVYDRKLRRSLSDVYLRPETSFKEYAAQGYPRTLEFSAREVVLERRPKETGLRFLGLARAIRWQRDFRREDRCLGQGLRRFAGGMDVRQCRD